MSDKSATPDQKRAAEKRRVASEAADQAAKEWRGEVDKDEAPSRSAKPKGRRAAETDKS